MTPERWQRIKKILDQAATAPTGQRRAILKQACGEDAVLLREAEALLELDDEVDDFIEEPLWTLHRQTEEPGGEADEPELGRRIGPYEIQRLLGRGGMGSVYLATRQDDYQQQVALKVLSWGTDSEELLARFFNERQILANLRHPHIARLLDGGTTEEGLPYFAMEYVEGEPIDLYCETHQLSIVQRLRLFRRVCAAVHFAHQNLIVHRDLKPGNILITADGTPQLLDFGIAKLLEPGLASRTVATSPGRAPMTPAYASPEQILGEQITTACDVYSLGVILYRLLIGHPPYELDGTSYAEMVQIVCLREPRRPSTAVKKQASVLAKEPTTLLDMPNPAKLATATIEAPDGTWQGAAHRLRRRIAGDLDAIVLKAMRKEPRHRYASAAELAEDIRRHLIGHPVSARQGTILYNLGKFLRRNKLALAAAIAIIAFAVTTTILWRQAVEERAQAVSAQAQAERERSRAERVSEFLEELFESADPDTSQGDSITVLEALDLGRKRIEVELEEEPEIRAEILGTLGTVYNKLGLYPQARELKDEALRVRRASDPEDRPDLAKDINNLASFLYSIGDYSGAENSFREALAMRRRLGQEDKEIEVTMHNLASTVHQQGNYKEAEDLHRRVLEIRRKVYGPTDPKVATSLYSLGSSYAERAAFESAEPLLREALNIRTQAFGPQNTKVAAICNSLGRMLQAKGDMSSALAFYERALAIRRKRLGEDHPVVATSQKNLASLLLQQGNAEEAGRLLDQAIATLKKSRPEGDWAIADATSLHGAYLTSLGLFQEAELDLIESYRTIRKIEGDHTISTRAALSRIIELYDAWDRPEKAEEYRAIADATSHGGFAFPKKKSS